MQRILRKWAPVFLLPVCVMFVFMYALPLATVLATSFTEYKLSNRELTFIGLQNYIRLFTEDSTFRTALRNTLVWILLQVFLHVGIGVVLALILYKKPKGWKFVRTVYMAPNIIASSAVGLIFLQVFNADYGLLNKLLELVGLGHWQRNWLFSTKTAFGSVTMTWFLFAAYTTTLVLARLLSISEDLFDAAKIDGANSLQVDLFIALPLAKSTITTTMVMAAAYMLTMFPLLYVTTNGGPGVATTNLPLYLYKTAMIENNYGYANTIGVVIIVVGILSMQLINRMMGKEDGP